MILDVKERKKVFFSVCLYLVKVEQWSFKPLLIYNYHHLLETFIMPLSSNQNKIIVTNFIQMTYPDATADEVEAIYQVSG